MAGQADVIVVGLGAVGSAALYQLARRGIPALGIDRFAPPHEHGSSHGDSRITRLALGEGSAYVQFARRAHVIWRELEAETGRSLLRTVGCLIFGADAPGAAHGVADFLQTTIAVAEQHGIPHQRLGAASLRRRFPQFRWRGDERACFEPGAGFVYPEACIAAQLEMARRLGARTLTGERVFGWTARADGVEVATDRETYAASRLIVAAGAWLPTLVPGLAAHLRVYRQVMFWFRVEGHDARRFSPDRMPVYVRLPDAHSAMFYGFPAIDGPTGGVKIAAEQFQRSEAADAVARDVSPVERDAMYALAAPHLRIAPGCLRAVACTYTVTPDFHFVIDHTPESDRVWFASACSGHGFKHSAAVGEALAEIAIDGRTQFDLSPFRISRLPAAS
jgi:sarcosine oxidase